MIPVDIVLLFLLLLIFSEKIILSDGGTGAAISLLIFSSYSFLLLCLFFPLFYLDGYEYSFYYALAYQCVLSAHAYLGVVYGIYFAWTVFNAPTDY